MLSFSALAKRIKRYRKRLQDPQRAEFEDYLESQVAKFKFWAPLYDLFFFLQTIGRTQEVREAALRKANPGEGRILDVCCGTGTIPVTLGRKLPQAQIYGLDVSLDMLKKAKAKVKERGFKNVKFIKADARDIPFSDNYFDYVINTFGLHEMPVKVMHQAIGEMSRVLKAEGKLILMDYQRPTYFPLKFLFDFIMFFWEPRGTFLYCNNQGILDCVSNCSKVNCFRGLNLNSFSTERYPRASGIITAQKAAN